MRLRAIGVSLLVVATALALAACKPRSVSEAETKRDVPWLIAEGSPEALAALGRLADTDARALAALEARSSIDVNTYIAAWGAVTRNAPWGRAFFGQASATPSGRRWPPARCRAAIPRLIPFINDLDAAVVRLSAARRSALIAGVLASIGAHAHAAVERRLVDAKTRGAMCEGIALPEASGDARSLVLAVPPEARDHASCVALVLDMASTEDGVLGWVATSAEPGLLTALAKGSLVCPRLATVWKLGLSSRPPASHAALTVPLQTSIRRCTSALDPALAELLAKAPRARAVIMKAIDPFGADLSQMTETCKALRAGVTKGESALVRERTRDALAHGCRFAK